MTTPATKSQMFQNAVALHRAGRHREAIAIYRELLAMAPDNHAVLDLIGMALTSAGDVDEGRRHLQRAIQLAPLTASYHHDLSLNFRRTGEFERSHASLDEALRLAPGTPSFLAAKAEMLMMEGRFDDAYVTLEPSIPSAASVPAVALVFGSLAPRVKREREAITAIEACLSAPNVSPSQRLKLLFRLGTLYDGLSEWDRAWDAFEKANAAYPARFDEAGHARAIDDLIAAWTPDAIAKITPSNVNGTRAVFIVGMPRSGTTLVEQILAASDQVFAAGELSEINRIARTLQNEPSANFTVLTKVDRLNTQTSTAAGLQYLNAAKKLNPAPRIVIDKMPFNFMHLGVIQSILPGSKIIHCTRDPMDIAVSCYTHLFDGNLTFAYDLRSIAKFYKGYERLMKHWAKVLSIPMLEVRYEDMVANQESMSKKLYEFVGLPWTDRALSFHTVERTSLTSSNQEVREPMYTKAVARHQHYEKYLGPLREELAK
ncbi:MAG: sulfotransferase [Phycisphaerae bacterium]|nr:sulfotransferase [Phycisphaerae bacterium]